MSKPLRKGEKRCAKCKKRIAPTAERTIIKGKIYCSYCE
jgi:hypothetical protein